MKTKIAVLAGFQARIGRAWRCSDPGRTASESDQPSPVHQITDAGARAMTPAPRRLGAARICPRIRDRRPRKRRVSRKPSCAARQPAKRRSCLHSPKKRMLPVPWKQAFYSTRWPEPVPDGISGNWPRRKVAFAQNPAKTVFAAIGENFAVSGNRHLGIERSAEIVRVPVVFHERGRRMSKSSRQ